MVAVGEEHVAAHFSGELGVLLFHLVTGRFPVEGESFGDIAAKHARNERNRLQDLRTDLPGVFVRVVERALQPERADRYQSAGELEQVLASHPRLHTAEGCLYRDVFRDACKVPAQIVPPASLDASKLGKLAGPPWGKDQKLAALAAWKVLKA